MLSLFNVPPDILTFEQSQFIQATQLAVQVLRDYPCCMKAEKRHYISHYRFKNKSSNNLSMYIQVRAVNEFHIAGSWSEAVTVDTPIPNFTIVTTNPPPGSSEIPSWVYIVIALVALPVLILILVVITVLVTRYNHKNSEPLYNYHQAWGRWRRVFC